MKPSYLFGATLMIGALLGGFVSTALRAQSTPLAYAVIEISDIVDRAAFDQVLQSTPMGLVPFSGRYVVRSDKLVAIEGTPPRRFVLIAFDTMDRALRWSASPAVKQTNDLRRTSAKWTSFLVEGVPQ